MQCVHAGSFPSHLIFFFLHMSQACSGMSETTVSIWSKMPARNSHEARLTLAILLLLASLASSKSVLWSANICAVMSGGSCIGIPS